MTVGSPVAVNNTILARRSVPLRDEGMQPFAEGRVYAAMQLSAGSSEHLVRAKLRRLCFRILYHQQRTA